MDYLASWIWSPEISSPEFSDHYRIRTKGALNDIEWATQSLPPVPPYLHTRAQLDPSPDHNASPPRQIMTRPRPMHIREGQDVEIQQEANPYKHLGILGCGSHGVVEKVQDTLSGMVYARKTFKLNKMTLDQAQEMLRQEVQVIRDVALHPHIIRVYATYRQGRTLAIILQPVADGGNLTDFLTQYRDLSPHDLNKGICGLIIGRAFGCLANAMAYLHSDSIPCKPVIRHKDIKPGNILIHEGFAILTDFGTSRRCLDDTTTSGTPGSFTYKYAAPEVADWDKRNRKADVFSLGCVFLEMIMSLYHESPNAEVICDSRAYHTRIDAILAVLQYFKWSPLAIVVAKMLCEDPVHRPAVSAVTEMMREANAIRPCSKCDAFSGGNTAPTNECARSPLVLAGRFPPGSPLARLYNEQPWLSSQTRETGGSRRVDLSHSTSPPADVFPRSYNEEPRNTYQMKETGGSRRMDLSPVKSPPADPIARFHNEQSWSASQTREARGDKGMDLSPYITPRPDPIARFYSDSPWSTSGNRGENGT